MVTAQFGMLGVDYCSTVGIEFVHQIALEGWQEL